MYSIESRFVIGPSNILFACVYVCTFQPGNFTGRNSKGFNVCVACMYVCTFQPGNFTGRDSKGFNVCVACTPGYAFLGIVLRKCGILLDSGRCNRYDLEGVRAGVA